LWIDLTNKHSLKELYKIYILGSKMWDK
jgi:hypothetical protein